MLREDLNIAVGLPGWVNAKVTPSSGVQHSASAGFFMLPNLGLQTCIPAAKPFHPATQATTARSRRPASCQVSSVELERVCVEGVPSVLEAAAVGVPAPGGGPEQLVLFLVPRQQQQGGGRREAADGVRAKCQAAIRARLNPLFKVERVSAARARLRRLCRGFVQLT